MAVIGMQSVGFKATDKYGLQEFMFRMGVVHVNQMTKDLNWSIYLQMDKKRFAYLAHELRKLSFK